MMILALDTETTGLPSWRDPSDAPHQPHLIQLAAILHDEAGREVERLSTIVRPGAGAVMEPEAFAAHGITLERAGLEGVCPVAVLERFLAMAATATIIVGHNVSFDIRIMRIHAARHSGVKWEAPCPTFCTMKRAAGIVNLPPTDKMRASGRNWPKPPRLGECIKHFFGEELEGAHDALNDVQASMRVFWHLTREMGVPMFKPPSQDAAPPPAAARPTGPTFDGPNPFDQVAAR